MKKKYSELRKKAEAILEKKGIVKNEVYYNDIEELIEELNIHQIELEMQNQELAKANSQLRKSEERYKDLYENAPVAYFTLNKTGNIIQMNKAASDLIGVEAHKSYFTSVFPYLDDGSKTTFLQYFKKVTTSGKAELGKMTFKHRDNTLFYTHVQCISYFDDQHNQRLFRLTVSDISKQKQLIDELKKSESRFKAIFEQATAGIAIAQYDGKILDANPKFCDLLGYKKHEMLQLSIKDISYTKDWENNELININDWDKNISSYHTEKRYVHKHGHTIWAEAAMNYVDDNDHGSGYVIGVIQDITRRKKAEEELRENERVFRAVFENSLTTILIADDKGNYLSVNNAAEKMFGYSIDELLTMNISNLQTTIHPNAAERYAKYLKKGKEVGEFGFITKQGEEKIALYHAVRVNKDFNISILSDITDRKRMEKALSESEKHFRTLTEASPIGIGAYNAQGFLVYTNPASVEIMGAKTKEDLLGYNMFNDPFLTDKHKQSLRNGECVHYESKVDFSKYPPELQKRLIKTGMICLDVIISPIDNQGDISYLVQMQDITERKNQTQELATIKARLDTMLQTMIDGVVTVDTNGKINYANTAAEKILEIERSEILKRTYITPDWKQIDEKGNPFPKEKLPLYIALKDRKEVYGVEHGIACANHQEKWISVNAVPLFNNKKQLSGAMASFRDITKDKQNKQALKESEELFRNIFEQSAIGLVEARADGRITNVNSKICEILGYSKDEFLTFSVNDITYPEDIDKAKPYEIQVLNGKLDSFHLEKRFLHKNGNVIWSYLHSNVVRDNNKKIKYVIGAVADINERKKAEQTLQQNAQKLSELNATKDRLLSIISHDLKNPINNIAGFAELIDKNYEKYTDEKRKHFNQLILRSVTSVAKLLENLLLWSRSQRNKISVEPETFPVADLVNNCIELLKPSADKKQIVLISKIPENVMVYADVDMITTVIRNLLSNAIKFTPLQGMVFIKAESKHNQTIIEVRDNGIGIEPDRIDKLFALDDTHTSVGTDGEKGTGLGLIICKEFIEQNKGKIWVKSEKDKGTGFFLELPDRAD